MNKPALIEATIGSAFRGARSGSGYRLAGTLTLLGLLAAPGVHGAPAGGNVVGGSGSIAQSGAITTITQDSARLAINWNSFSSKAGESIVFRQPGPSAIALNRVIGTGASELSGSLNANGQVFILNPNGVLFGAGATVNAQGLLASTLDMDPARFMQGGQEHALEGTGAGSLGNQGKLTANPGGYIALIAPKVVNQGSVSAQQGYVLMAAGDKARVQLSDSGLLDYTTDRGSLDALVDNRVAGMISANGGKVRLEAKAADALGKALVNHDGMIEAQTLNRVSGQVKLLGDMKDGQLMMNGRIDVSAPVSGDGGLVETSAAKVKILDGAQVYASSREGAGGKWIIDPVDMYIVGSDAPLTESSIGNQTVENFLKTSNGFFSVSTTGTDTGPGGNLFVQAPISWSGAKLELSAARNIYINANLSALDGGGLILATGQIAGGTGSYFLNNAKITLGSSATFSTRQGLNGTPIDYTVIREVGTASNPASNTLQGMQPNGKYVLADDINALDTKSWNGGAGFSPLAGFNGILDGLGHEIKDLVINRPALDNAGLFASTTAAAQIRNLGLVNADVTGRATTGILVGKNLGSLVNVHSTGKVEGKSSGTNIADNIGGLIGENEGGVLVNAWSSASVSGRQAVGGLVGFNHESVASRATISNSYATGDVTGTPGEGLGWVGGLVGLHRSSDITTSYAAGKVAGLNRVGGLVGGTLGGLIEDSYAAGAVNGETFVGGLVGQLTSESIVRRTYATGGVTGTEKTITGGLIGGVFENTPLLVPVVSSYWNTDPISSGGTGIAATSNTDLGQGKSGTDLVRVDTFQNGWSISKAGGSNAVWRIYEGKTMPLLRNFLQDVSLADRTPMYNGAEQGGPQPGAPRLDFTRAKGTNVGTYSPWSTQQGYDIAGGNLTITPAPLTVTTENVSKTYDGTNAASGVPISINNTMLFGGDKFSGGTFVFNDKHASAIVDGTVQADKTVIVRDVTINNKDGENISKNYLVSYELNRSSKITPAPLTVTTENVTKTYDGTPTASGVPIFINNTKLYGEDKFSGGTFVFNDKHASAIVDGTVQADKTVIVGDVTINDGNGGKNYQVTYQESKGNTIKPALVTFTMEGTANKTYDGTPTVPNTPNKPAATIASGQIFTDQGDSFSGGTFVFKDRNASAIKDGEAQPDKTVIVSDVTVSDGNGGKNYQVTYKEKDGNTIKRAPLTVSVDNVVKTYDGALTAAATPFVSNGTLFRNDSLNNNGTFAFTDRNAGIGNKTVSVSGVTVNDGNGGGNYQVSYAPNRSSTINAAVLAVSTANVAKTYDGTVNAPGAAAAIVEGRLYDGDTLNGGTFAFTDRNAGIGNKTVSVSGVTVNDGNGGGNYQVSYAPNRSSTINPAVLTVSAGNVAKTYDGTVNAPGAAAAIVEGRLGKGDTLNGGAFAFADRNAGIGNKTVTVSGITVNDGNGGNNYLLRLSPNLSSTISPAPLTVTANGDRKAYDTIPYEGGNGVVIAGLTGGDSADALGGQLGYGGTAQGALLPGSYRITPAGLQSQNYAISYASGTLQIDQPPDLTSRVNVLNPMQRPGAEQTPMIGGATVQVAGCGVSLPANALGMDCIATSAQHGR